MGFACGAVNKQYIGYSILYIVYSCCQAWGSFFCDLVDGISHSCGHKWDLKWDMVRLRREGPYAGAGVLTSERRVRNLTRAYSF